MTPFFYIFTRSGNRKQCFTIFKESLEKQNFKNYINSISNDNPENDFLSDEKNIIHIPHSLVVFSTRLATTMRVHLLDFTH